MHPIHLCPTQTHSFDAIDISVRDVILKVDHSQTRCLSKFKVLQRAWPHGETSLS